MHVETSKRCQTIPSFARIHADDVKAVSYETLRTAAGSSIKGSVIDVRDEKWVTQLWRAVGHIFAPGQIDAYEGDVEQVCQDLLNAIREENDVEMFTIMSQFQGDVLMKIAFSKQPELVRTGQNNEALSFHPRFKHWVKWQALPFLEAMLFKPPLPLCYMMRQSVSPWLELVEKRLHDQMEPDGDSRGTERKDLLTKYHKRTITKRNALPKDAISRMVGSTIQAGVDTTALTVTTVFCYLCQNADVMKALRDELSEAKISPNPKNSEIRSLPLLASVIKESMRLYPSARILLEREVPQNGVCLSKHFLPPGTVVGCHPRVVNYNEAFYGADVARFRPERWMLHNASKVAAMERASLGFGNGKRKCRGQYLAEMVIKKVVAIILLNFDVSPAAWRLGFNLHGLYFADITLQLSLRDPHYELRPQESCGFVPAPMLVRFTSRENRK